MSHDQFAEVEIVIVERVNQLAHGLDPRTQFLAVGRKLSRRKIAARQGPIRRIAGQFPAPERQEDPRREHRVQEGERVAGQDQAVRRAILRAIRELSRHPILFASRALR